MTLRLIAKTLLLLNNFVILCHAKPDGDTTGAAFALADALKRTGKKVRVECADEFLDVYRDITSLRLNKKFEPRCIIAVDVPDIELLGSKKDEYPKVNICIDHHGTHKPFADVTYVESTAASCCEIIMHLLLEMNGDVTNYQAMALYTGIATDTGCFRFSNTTAITHALAEKLLMKNFDAAKINSAVFSKKKNYAMLEGAVLSNAQFFYNDTIAVQCVTEELLEQYKVSREETGRIAATLADIEGVKLAITLYQEGAQTKVSARSHGVSAADFCQMFGGGGHKEAAGCRLNENLGTAMWTVVGKATRFMMEQENVAIGVGEIFVIVPGKMISNIDIKPANVTVSVDGVDYSLYKGSSFLESKKVDDLLDNNDLEEYNIKECRKEK